MQNMAIAGQNVIKDAAMRVVCGRVCAYRSYIFIGFFCRMAEKAYLCTATVLHAVGVADREMKRETGENPVQFPLL